MIDDMVEDDLGDSVKMQLKFESIRHFYLQSQTSSSDTVPSTSEGNVQNNITSHHQNR